MIHINESGKKCSSKESQVFMIDGCKVKVNFLSGKAVNDKQNVLNNIQKILLAPNFEK